MRAWMRSKTHIATNWQEEECWVGKRSVWVRMRYCRWPRYEWNSLLAHNKNFTVEHNHNTWNEKILWLPETVYYISHVYLTWLIFWALHQMSSRLRETAHKTGPHLNSWIFWATPNVQKVPRICTQKYASCQMPSSSREMFERILSFCVTVNIRWVPPGREETTQSWKISSTPGFVLFFRGFEGCKIW